MRGDDTRDRIKLAARRLFAERGIDGVSIREIVAAAGQRNVGSLHYYFRTKEALIRELIVDGVRQIDERRSLMLDELEKRGGPKKLRDIVDVLIIPAIGVDGVDGVDGEEDTFFRFFIMLQLNHRKLFSDAIGKQWSGGFDRCFAHIKRLLPNLPPQVINQRMFFVVIYLSSVFAARETAVGKENGKRAFWTLDYTISNLADTVQALLECKSSAQTVAMLEPRTDFTKRSRGASLRMAEVQ